jgi:uncharacterized protein
MKNETLKKFRDLQEYLKNLGEAAIAFSGGTDSTLLLAVAKNIPEVKVLAITAKTPYMPDWELKEAEDFIHKKHIEQIVVNIGIHQSIRNNPPERCYLCKSLLFKALIKAAQSKGFIHVMDGTNASDTSDYRPGLRALRELKIKSPLLETGITKEEVREISAELNLPTWNKPAYACLLTRLPFNHPIDETELKAIEKAEVYLMDEGYKEVRVRKHNNLARIELPQENIGSFITQPQLPEIVEYIKKAGFAYVTVDLSGYSTGSFNQEILKSSEKEI